MAPAAFFSLVTLEEWDDFHHICLTADQLVLTQPLLARSGRFVASFLVSFNCGWSLKLCMCNTHKTHGGQCHWKFCLE